VPCSLPNSFLPMLHSRKLHAQSISHASAIREGKGHLASLRTLDKWIYGRVIPSVRVGRVVRLDPEKCDKALEAFEQKSRWDNRCEGGCRMSAPAIRPTNPLNEFAVKLSDDDLSNPANLVERVLQTPAEVDRKAASDSPAAAPKTGVITAHEVVGTGQSLAKTDSRATPDTRKFAGPFQYDKTQGILCDTRTKRQVLVPRRFVPVLEALLAKDVLTSCRRGFLNYNEMAMAYYAGWIEENVPNSDKRTKAERMRAHYSEVEANPKYHAQACARDIYRWLRRMGFDPGLLLRCDWKNQVYVLGAGWHHTKPVINAREARLESWKDPERKSDRKLSDLTSDQDDQDCGQDETEGSQSSWLQSSDGADDVDPDEAEYQVDYGRLF
jgi:hypothetical protein